MVKNIYKILLISLFIIVVFTIKSYGASDFTYTLDTNGNATITAYNGSKSDLTIPSTIDGHNVVAIGAHAFEHSKIKNIVVSEGITTIGGWAFCECENLENVILPESLTYMDWQVFIGCKNLNNINIPSNLTFINQGCFIDTGIKEIIIPKNIQKFIGSEFRGCKSLKKVYIYNDNLEYYNNNYDTNVFELCSSDLILYGNEGSTTQTYAQKKGIEFRTIDSSEEPPITTMGAIHLNKNELSLKENESETLTVSFIEMDSSTKVRWSSSNENVAIVENGKITARSIGNTIITVSTEDGKYKDTCNVTVIKKETSTEPTIIPITSIFLNKSSISLYIGDTETLVATILPNNATDKDLLWSSSNSNIVSVENGKITAKGIGSAAITVSNTDGTQKATCSVTVINKESASEKVLDSTTANRILPQTGENIVIITTSIIAIILIVIIMYRKYNNYKDIK